MLSNILKTPFYQDFKQIVEELSLLGNCYLVGGAARDLLHGKVPRDLDIVVETDKEICLTQYSFTKNRFNGLKVNTPFYDVDVWRLQDTWGIKHSNLNPNIQSYFLTTFFSIDSLVYDLTNDEIIQSTFYKDSFQRKVLDIVYLPNPHPVSVCARSFYLATKYDMNFSPLLKEFLLFYLPHIKEEEFHQYQMRHYKTVYTNYEEALKSMV